MNGNGKDETPGMPAEPVVVAQVVLDPDRRTMTVMPGPMVSDPVLFYQNMAAVASRKAMELLMAERMEAEAETRKKPQILRPTSWPSDLKGGPQE